MSGDGGELENSNVPLGKEIRQLNDLTNEEQNEWNHVNTKYVVKIATF